MRCEDCRWWDSSTQHGSAEPDTTGMCRVRPPVADERDATARWAFTADTDWCASFSAARPENDPERLYHLECLVADLSGHLADEGMEYGPGALDARRRRVAATLSADRLPDWLKPYAETKAIP